jgi:dephospho-CoA kinase
MKTVGLTGQSGTGKSTIAAHLTMRGGVHLDADNLAHGILAHDPDVRESIRSQIRPDVFDKEGRLDRRRLGAVVFNDESLLDKLNEITHPAIRKTCGERIKELEKSGVPFVIVDAALLLTSQMPFKFDLMIALDCKPQEQFARLMAKGGRTEEEVRARLRNQKYIRDSLHKADVVVDTHRPKDVVFAEIDALVDELLKGEGLR